MAHKRFGGWVIKDKLYVCLKVANELWYYGGKDGKEVQKHLVFFGWYENKEEPKAKLFSITFLWVSLQIGFAK